MIDAIPIKKRVSGVGAPEAGGEENPAWREFFPNLIIANFRSIVNTPQPPEHIAQVLARVISETQTRRGQP